MLNIIKHDELEAGHKLLGEPLPQQGPKEAQNLTTDSPGKTKIVPTHKEAQPGIIQR